MTFLKFQNDFSHILKSYKAIKSLFADFNRYFLSCKLRKKTLSLHEYLLKKSSRTQKRATLHPPYKHNRRIAPLRGGRYQPNRTRCKLVMTVNFIRISKEKKGVVENFSQKRLDVSKKFVQILRKFVQIFCRTCGEHFSSLPDAYANVS